jgi:hypothetical protein
MLQKSYVVTTPPYPYAVPDPAGSCLLEHGFGLFQPIHVEERFHQILIPRIARTKANPLASFHGSSLILPEALQRDGKVKMRVWVTRKGP